MACCNGGHPPPYLVRPGGEIVPLASTGGLALGVLSDFVYASGAMTIQKGDTLYLYSDGVTEAADARYDLFEAPRLEKALGDLKDRSPREMIDGTMARIKDFTREAPQTDDITMLAIKYFGPGGGRPSSD